MADTILDVADLKVDFRTDLFALGIVLYEMLAGEKPWPEEKGRSVTVKVLDEPAIPLAKVCPSAPAELQASDAMLF